MVSRVPITVAETPLFLRKAPLLGCEASDCMKGGAVIGHELIHLNVTLDATLVQHLRDSGLSLMEAAWTKSCRRYTVTDLGGAEFFCKCDKEPTLNELSLLDDTESFVDSNLRQSIQHITIWLPEVDDKISQPVTVACLPYGKHAQEINLKVTTERPEAPNWRSVTKTELPTTEEIHEFQRHI